MKPCALCDKAVIENNLENYREVTSWVTGPKLDGPILRQQTGRIAHKKCVENLAHGQAPDQPELFPEEDDAEEPLLTDEPGKITKLTGPNSVHAAIQERKKKKRKKDDEPS